MTIDQLSFPDDDDPLTLQDPLRVSVAALIGIYGYIEVERMVRLQAPTAFIPSAPARIGDPETSHMAAKRDQDVGKFSDRSRQARLLHAFSGNDLTDQQAAARVVGAHAAISAFEGCRRRCSDLRAARFITDSGKRHCNTGSDDESIVWTITDAGHKALIRLDETGWSR